MRGTMKLDDSCHNGRMVCRLCNSAHYASIRPMSGGKFYRGSWQCSYGCKPDDLNDQKSKTIQNNNSNKRSLL